MRILKTKWFCKVAKTHDVKDSELCQLIEAVMQGNADDLGEGVYKTQLDQIHDRAIILIKGGENWFYTFMYANQDMANIDDRELTGFRELAKYYATLTDKNIKALKKIKVLAEICHGCKK